MRFEGSIEEIIYRNPDNGYSVLRVNLVGELGDDTCVGFFPIISEGESLIMEGEWVYNSNFGKQISVKSAQVELPSGERAVLRYLSSGLFKGIGPKLATKIYLKFKERTFDVIENYPNELSKVRSISYQKACEISQAFREQKDIQKVIMYLQSYEISINLALKLYKAYGIAVQMKLEENPYQLIKDVEGVGFVTADTIAQKMGVTKDSKFRIKAGIAYVLSESARKSGDTYIKYDNLVRITATTLSLDYEEYVNLIETCIRESEEDNEIVTMDDNENVMSKYFYKVEKNIARKLVALMNSNQNTFFTDIDLDIKTFQKVNNIELHEKQIEAIKNSLMYGVNIITGGPGTGKTTIVKAILSILSGMNKTCALCAPTGRAAKRLSESTGLEAKTIHRLLGLSFVGGSPAFSYDEHNELPYDVIIIDEVSMCDAVIFEALIRSVKLGTRFIMLGDKDQLPSVGAGNVLSDMIRSKVIPVSYLTCIFRQTQDSMIVLNAYNINNGIMPKLDNKNKDFFFIEENDSNKMVDTIVSLITTRLPKTYNIAPEEIQVLCPVKRGIVGVENLNEKIQDAVNSNNAIGQILREKTRFRLGDRVIHTENNYKLEWKSAIDNSLGVGVFNGDMGYITEIDANKPLITVLFDDGKIATYSKPDIEQLSLAYAISIHKSQGSEFKIAIIALPISFSPIMTRNLLYTGVTRAKEMVVIVGSKQSVSRAIANNKILERNSKLLQFLQQEAEYSLDRE